MNAPTLTPRAAQEQRTFRALLDAMARPGSISQVVRHEHGEAFAPAISVLEALLDHEVTFAVLPERADLVEVILRQTGSHSVALEEAAYVLCDGGSLLEALQRARIGELEYPDRSATIVCLVEAIESEATSGRTLELSGPGIKDTCHLSLSGVTADAVVALREVNALPPLGVDVVLVTPAGSFACINRYTQLKEVI